MGLESYPTLRALLAELSGVARIEEGPEPGQGTRVGRGIVTREGRDTMLIFVPGVGRFWLDARQREVMRVLLDAFLNTRVPDVPEDRLVRAAGARGRLGALFVSSRAWGSLIVPGARPGSYRLAQPAAEEEEGEPETRVERCEE